MQTATTIACCNSVARIYLNLMQVHLDNCKRQVNEIFTRVQRQVKVGQRLHEAPEVYILILDFFCRR